MQITTRQNLIIASLGLLIGGCASEPAPAPAPAPTLSGEQMLSESQGLANLGDRWQKGKQLVDRGNALVREGQNKVLEGQRLIEEGERIKTESEEGYKSIKR
ncbi:MAG: hypothetical protein ACXWF8_17910 [Methylobacter sp.]